MGQEADWRAFRGVCRGSDNFDGGGHVGDRDFLAAGSAVGTVFVHQIDHYRVRVAGGAAGGVVDISVRLLPAGSVRVGRPVAPTDYPLSDRVHAGVGDCAQSQRIFGTFRDRVAALDDDRRRHVRDLDDGRIFVRCSIVIGDSEGDRDRAAGVSIETGGRKHCGRAEFITLGGVRAGFAELSVAVQVPLVGQRVRLVQVVRTGAVELDGVAFGHAVGAVCLGRGRYVRNLECVDIRLAGQALHISRAG